MGRPRKLAPGEDPRFEQTMLFDTRSKAGRKETGRGLINADYSEADNTRKSRSLWTTRSENEFMKAVLVVFRSRRGFRSVKLGEIYNDYMATHPNSDETLEGGK